MTHKDHQPDKLYHLVSEMEFRSLTDEKEYTPLFFEQEGFFHFDGEDELISLANEFFNTTEERILLLEIDISKLLCHYSVKIKTPEQEKIRHIQGPVNLDAITGIRCIRNNGEKMEICEFYDSAEQFVLETA